MSSETRQRVEELLVFLPWVAFVIAAAWCSLLELRDNVRASRTYEPGHLGQPAKQLERRHSTSR